MKPWHAMLLLLALLTPAAQASLDAIVAVVNDDVILASELDSAVRKYAIQFRDRGINLPPKTIFERQVLDRLINERLQLNAAREAGIRIDDSQLNRALQAIARGNGMNLSEMRQLLVSEGVSFELFRDEVQNELLLKELKEREIKRRIRITDQEVDSWLKRSAQQNDSTEYHLAHILIATPEGASTEQLQASEEKARKLVELLRDGADFGDVARVESSGQSALEGGDLGWRKIEAVPSLFVDALRDMKVGEISDPIRSNSGFNIVRLVDLRGVKRELVEQTEARHILIRTNEVTSDRQAQTRLEQLRQRIIGGTDFGDIARGNSDDKGSALKGGELGWLSPGDTVPEFEEQMSKLKPGEISEPFRTEFGWHIVQVEGRRSHDGTEEMRKAEARNAIGNRKLEEEYELYVRRLRDEAFVDIRLGKRN